MSDVEHVLSAAVSEEAAATLTPPFAAVVRLRRRTQAAQVLAAAAAVLAVVGGVALAVPDRERVEPASPAPSPLRPFQTLHRDTAAVAEINRCMRARGHGGPSEGLVLRGENLSYTGGYDECFRLAGYEPPVNPLERFGDPCGPYSRQPESGTAIARGTFAGRTWVGRVVLTPEGKACVGYTFGGDRYAGLLHDREPGSSSMDPLVPGAKQGSMLFYGSVEPGVVRILVSVAGRTHQAETVRVEGVDDRRFYVFTVPYADGPSFAYSRADYAADGTLLDTAAASFPLH